MIQQFDFFNAPELPYISLANPDGTELFSLGLAYDTRLTKRFNTLSEFGFSYPKSIDGGITELEPYDYLKNKRLVIIENEGVFQITSATEDADGSTPIMRVECKSLESELIQRKINSYSGTQKLYDLLDPSGTILGYIVSLVPNWTVGTISTSLLTKFRTFSVSDSNIYNFLMSDVATAFECVFSFDTTTRTINAYSIADATTETDVFLSYDNIISRSSFLELSDELTTALAIYGKGNLNIRLVNPLGSDKIYSFDYFKTSEWMSAGLISAITAWEALITSVQATYASTLTLLSTYNSDLLVLQSDLADLNSDLLTLEGTKAVRIQGGLSLTAINADIVAKQAQITAQESLITNKNLQISSTTVILTGINTQVSFAENFTSAQLLELDSFIFENSYLNENIVQTDSMTLVEIQAQAQELYDQGQNVLERISQPRYEFDLEAVNYTVIEDFQVFTQQTDVGSIVTCELQDGTFIETVLLELEMQFDNPEDFTLKFSNRLRLDDGNFTYSDLMGSVQKVGSDVSFDSTKWANWSDNYEDSVSTFITSSLNATLNNIKSNTNQELLINQNGLIGRSWDAALAAYKPKQVWLTNEVLAFSNDSFNTAKLALGEITLPTGGTAYGLVGEVIVGRIIAGSVLTISNDNNNFVLDQTGATLTNAKFSIQTTNTKVIIDPTSTISFRIQKNEGGTFTDKFWVDNTGNVNFSGNLSGATGTFSGTLSASVGNIGSLVIDSLGLKTSDGVNYLRGNGDLKWGALSITSSSAVFTGDIYANKLVGAVSYSQLTDIPADKITSGTMSGSRIYGGTIYGPGMSFSLTGTGVPTLIGNTGLSLVGGSGSVNVGNPIVMTNTYIGGSLQVTGSIYISGGYGGYGRTVAIYLTNYSKYMYFSNGILTGW